MQKDIRTLSLYEITEFVELIGEKKFRAKQIWEWLWKKSIRSFDLMTSLSVDLREKLKESFTFETITINSQHISTDKTVKFSFKLADENLIEGVLIPSGDRVTACISTQAGCPLKCEFCATGQYGFKRNLTAGEIFDQVALINEYSQKINHKNLTNIVIMGMGEPLLNTNAVVTAIRHLTSPLEIGMSPSRITLSTAGIVSEIYKFADMKTGVNLAISLHSAIQSVRESIMPIAKTNKIPELIKALKYYHEVTNDRITFEYLLLDNINDNKKDAQALANFCKNFPVKINIIEYNEVSELPYKRSSAEIKEDMITFLEDLNIVVQVRRSRGVDIAAACGQLANQGL